MRAAANIAGRVLVRYNSVLLGRLPPVRRGQPKSAYNNALRARAGETATAHIQSYWIMVPLEVSDTEQFKAEILSWVPPDHPSYGYAFHHLVRLARTLSITPPGGPEDHALEMGAYSQITPALHFLLGYGHIHGSYLGRRGKTEKKKLVSADGRRFQFKMDLFDAERDKFPYRDGSLATVLCCELLEHLREDPMHAVCECNRVLRDGGHLVLTTPNIASLDAVRRVLEGANPGYFTAYLRGKPEERRHSREYTPLEIRMLFEAAGFETVLLETGPLSAEEGEEPQYLTDIRSLLAAHGYSTELRGTNIYAVARKAGPPRERHPAWLYY